MKAIRIHKTGGPEVLSFEDVDAPCPAPGQVLVRNTLIGVNFIDTYHRAGLYPVPLPFTPGIEAAGRVLGWGKGVSGFREGEEVLYCMTRGSYAESTAVESWKVVPRPSNVSPEAGVAAMCQGLTAHYLVTDSYPIRKGETILIHAAAGGVGLLLVQMAKKLGANVIGTVSTAEKAAKAAQAGADFVIDYRVKDFEEEVKKITEGSGVSVVYESVGKVTFDKSLNCLKPRGYLVLFGQSSGPVPKIDPQVLNQKGSLFLTRPSLFHYVSTAEEFAKRANSVLSMMSSGNLKVTVGARFPLQHSADAHRQLESRKTMGKVLLVP